MAPATAQAIETGRAQGEGEAGPSTRRPALLALLLGIATVVCAASLPRDTLWGVEATCILNYRATGGTFPCVEVNLDGGIERGYAVLRAPFHDTHLVTMPTARLSGIEAPQLRAADAPNYFADAWTARRFIQADLKRPMSWSDAGLAVNSRSTRSQDQLHIHVDCVQSRVKSALAERFDTTPTDSWQADGYAVYGQTYWIRRVDKPTLDGVNPFRLAAEIPVLQARPDLTTLAAIGVTGRTGHNGFMLLAGQSDPALAARQSTAEDLLDHACRRFR